MTTCFGMGLSQIHRPVILLSVSLLAELLKILAKPRLPCEIFKAFAQRMYAGDLSSLPVLPLSSKRLPQNSCACAGY